MGPNSKKLLTDAIQKFDLDLDENFGPALKGVVNYGRSLDRSIVGETGGHTLQLGVRQSTHFDLPGDYRKALEAIGKFFNKI